MHQGVVLDRVVFVDQPLIPLMQVHRAWMHGTVCGGFVDSPDDPPRGHVDNVNPFACRRSQVDGVDSPFWTGPEQPISATSQYVLACQRFAYPGKGRPVKLFVRRGEVCLLGGRGHVRAEHIRVIRVQHSRFHRGREQ